MHLHVESAHLVDYRKCEEIRKDTKRKWPIRGVTKEEFLNGISDERAKELFVSDLKKTELAVLQSIKVPLFQYEFDAIVSLVFNCGPGFLDKGGKGGKETKIKRYINNGDYYSGAKEFLYVTNGGKKGLVNRRNAEFDIFTANTYINHK